VWRDRKLSGADAFSDEIFKQLENTAVLVSVLTPGYAESKWCQDELREFQKAAAQNGGLRVGNKMRVIKIVKTPMENDQHRHIVSEALGFEFYQHAPDDPDFRELHCDTEKFIDKVDSVAQEICRVLRGMRTQQGRDGQEKVAVYLAETTSDLTFERHRILHELRAQGYRVLPDSPLPDDDLGYEAAVRDMLA